MDFSSKWISWIKPCIGSPSFSISVNGNPAGFIKSSCGLRQGNPPSPYIFSLVMKSITVMLDLEVHRCTLSLPPKNHGISHLIFADDVLVVCKGDKKSLMVVEVFTSFAAMSGLIVSKQKSHLFLSKTCKQRRGLCQTLGVQEGMLPIKYSSIPLIDSKLKHKHPSWLVEQLRERLASFLCRPTRAN